VILLRIIKLLVEIQEKTIGLNGGNIKMKDCIMDNLRRTLKFTVGHVHYFVVYLEMTHKARENI